MRFYVSEEYVLSIQAYCASRCPGEAHQHLDPSSQLENVEPIPLSVLEPCVAAINATGGGYWGYCLYNDEQRSQLLHHVILHSSSLLEAIDSIGDYSHLISNALDIKVHSTADGGLAGTVRLVAESSPVAAFLMNAVLGAGMLNLAEFLQGLGLLELPREAWHDETLLREELDRLGLVVVQDESSSYRHITFHSDLVGREASGMDRRLRRLLTRELDKRISRIPGPESLAEAVEHYLSQNLEQGVDLEAVCDHFHKSRRTLSRQLQQEGTGFVAIRDQVRKQRAMELISRPRMPLTQVARLCGYNSLSAFTQSFIQWTGKSPGRYRADLS